MNSKQLSVLTDKDFDHIASAKARFLTSVECALADAQERFRTLFLAGVAFPADYYPIAHIDEEDEKILTFNGSSITTESGYTIYLSECTVEERVGIIDAVYETIDDFMRYDTVAYEGKEDAA